MNSYQPQFYARNVKEWRNWFHKNHKTCNKIWLIHYKKHTKKPSISHQESMDEAICFGWIDTTIKKIDDERYLRGFAKRNKSSRWSNATLSYARRLIRQKKMTKSGLLAYEEGRKKPTLDAGYSKNVTSMPGDLKKALKKRALEKFNQLAPSYRKLYMNWVGKAVRKETRQKRIKAILEQLKTGKKPSAM